ncbi:putative periplasmic lipoprotein [Pontiella sulfatireligans]|uniref:Uncharacterized protein n=1 Tax=Pontiella sulfatireligans TaxID=2750658 RepID=A0A6C2UNL3_9BACT|nr:hypothetical protein [Pontiella sulfatireligans]VGO21533.1 hypothetical protein SCARR_03607 [Pontiella sulfatireligans]
MKKYMMACVAGGALSLAGCSTMKSNSAIAVEPSREVMITNVSVQQGAGVVEVAGTLHPMSAMVRQAGHVDIAFLGEDGEVLKEMKSQPDINIFSRKSLRRPGFAVSAEFVQAGFKKVQLIHHAGLYAACPR